MEEGTKGASELSRRAAFEIEVTMLRRDRMTQIELARRSGLPQPYISRRLTGQVEFTLGDLERIARALDVEVGALLPVPSRSDQGVTAPYRTPADRPSTDRPTPVRICSGGIPHQVDPRSANTRPTRTAGRRPTVRSWTHDGVAA